MSRKPRDTPLRQQTGPVWEPQYSSNVATPAFFVFGIIFNLTGSALYVASGNVQEFVLDYTHCKETNSGLTCDERIKRGGTECQCLVDFKLNSLFPGQVFLYYQLTNFYQNHRSYVKSRDDDQLTGKDLDPDDLDDHCHPYRTTTGKRGERLGYAPCGKIANSLFNDTFQPEYAGGSWENVSILRSGLTWDTDKGTRFNNPRDWKKSKYTKPPNWNSSVWSRRPGYLSDDFIVWMRTASLPTFRKLYGRVDHTPKLFEDGLPKGSYRLTIDYRYPVTAFGGTKSIILSTTSWLGGKNPFLGLIFLVTGNICLVLGCFFVYVRVNYGQHGLPVPYCYDCSIVQDKGLS